MLYELTAEQYVAMLRAELAAIEELFALTRSPESRSIPPNVLNALERRLEIGFEVSQTMKGVSKSVAQDRQRLLQALAEAIRVAGRHGLGDEVAHLTKVLDTMNKPSLAEFLARR
jgi:chorismate mutase